MTQLHPDVSAEGAAGQGSGAGASNVEKSAESSAAQSAMGSAVDPASGASGGVAGGGVAGGGRARAAAVDPAHLDPVTGLYKMSTTAGVGSQEYVAINVPSVITALFGAASFLALMSDVLLVVPVVGVICGIVALRQIRNSNGTQTGSGWSWLGIVVCVGLICFVVGRDVMADVQTRADKQAIAALCQEFGEDCTDPKKYDQAYDLFSERFHSGMPLERFREGMQHMAAQYVGNVTAATWNGEAAFQTDPDLGAPIASGMIKFTYKNVPGSEDREPVAFRKDGGVWKIDNMLSIFPKSAFNLPTPGAGAGAGADSGAGAGVGGVGGAGAGAAAGDAGSGPGK